MKVAVICAFPANLNPGMLSVDLAFLHVKSVLPNPIEITFFCVEGDFELVLGDTRLEYNILRSNNQLDDFDTIVFWGDFLHWYGYFIDDFLFRIRRRYPEKSESELLDLWYGLFFFENREVLQERTIIFGGTLYSTTASQLIDARYLDALSALYGRARLVLMRDVISVALVNSFGKDGREHPLGCDCAFLLQPQELISQVGPTTRPAHERYILTAFQRSGSTFALNAFAAYMASGSGAALVQLNWLDRSGVPGLARKLELIRHAQYVLTDIYHLSVASLRDHVPTLCFGHAKSLGNSTRSDKKKEILFRQTQASENYVYIESVVECFLADQNMKQLVTRYLNVVQSAAANAKIFSIVDNQKERALQRLVDGLGPSHKDGR